jgi:hypothetical protein
LVGDLGGVSELLIKFFGVFMGSIAYISFVFEAIEDIYLLKFKQGDKITITRKDEKKKLRVIRNS